MNEEDYSLLEQLRQQESVHQREQQNLQEKLPEKHQKQETQTTPPTQTQQSFQKEEEENLSQQQPQQPQQTEKKEEDKSFIEKAKETVIDIAKEVSEIIGFVSPEEKERAPYLPVKEQEMKEQQQQKEQQQKVQQQKEQQKVQEHQKTTFGLHPHPHLHPPTKKSQVEEEKRE
jgi:hypothetical protein